MANHPAAGRSHGKIRHSIAPSPRLVSRAMRQLPLGLVWLALACGSSSSGGLGAGGVGGESAGGSAQGGSAQGGAGGTTQGGSGGGGPVSCVSDKDCTPLGLLCNKSLGECVSCVTNVDCDESAECLAGSCHPITTCANSLDCPDGEVCDPARLHCYECLTPADCGPGKICLENTCRSDGSVGGAGGGGNGGNGGSSGSGGSGGNGGNGGSSGNGGSGGGTGCGDLYLLVDRSASLQDSNRWQDLKGAIQSFVGEAATARMRLGMGFFPVVPSTQPTLPASCTKDSDCGSYGPCLAIFNQCNGGVGSPVSDSCDVPDYAVPAVNMMAFPAAESSINTKLAAAMPDGGTTPITPALAGALQYARGATQAGRRGAVVLLTDGEPTGCTLNTVQSAAGVADTAFRSNPSVRTYVVGLGPLQDLNPIAAAGGTNAAYITSSATPQPELVSALRQIRAAEGCQ